jgi:hypothetical protein
VPVAQEPSVSALFWKPAEHENSTGKLCFVDPYRLPCGKRAWNWEQFHFIPPDDDADACQISQTLVTRVDDRESLRFVSAISIESRKHDGVDHYEYHHICFMRRPAVNSEQAAR